jgi:hypothetical protein
MGATLGKLTAERSKFAALLGFSNNSVCQLWARRQGTVSRLRRCFAS